MRSYPVKISYSRRKWVRRGRSITDFTLGVFITIVQHLSMITFLILKSVIKVIQKSKKITSIRSRGRNSEDSLVASEQSDGKRSFEPLRNINPGVYFSDIAGLEDAKREINLRMIMPFKYPKQAARHRIRRGGGLLLYGPPGTGKTMMARAVATELKASFYHIRPSDIISGHVGQAEGNVANLFKRLRSEKKLYYS